MTLNHWLCFIVGHDLPMREWGRGEIEWDDVTCRRCDLHDDNSFWHADIPGLLYDVKLWALYSGPAWLARVVAYFDKWS